MILQADPATTHALVVGIETYGNLLGTLDGPAANARAFAGWLLSRGVPAANVRLHLAPAPVSEGVRTAHPVEHRGATENEIRDALRGLHGIEASFLFVYWSGHAYELNGRLRMLVADGDPAEVRNLDLDSLLDALRTSDFGRIGQQAVLVDTCRLPVAPGDQPRFRAGDVPPGPSRRPYRQLVLLSAQPNQPAANAGGTGVFSERLLAELERAPEAPWPPELEEIAERLRPEEGAGLQAPALWRFRGWHDQREEMEILGAEPPRARNTPPLTPERRRQLLELLGPFPETGTPEGRERLVARLHRGPEVRALAGDLSDPDGTLDTLVDLCARWPDGIMDLVGAVRAGDPASPAAEALELAFPAGSLAYAQLDALWPLVLQVDLWGDHLQQLYRNSLPHHAASHPAARTTAAVVRVLADMTRQEGSFPFPVLEFVERVAAYAGEIALSVELRAWVDQVGAELEVDAAAVAGMRRRVLQLAPARSGDAHLQLSVRRSAFAPDTLLVKGWYRPDAMAAVPVLDREVSGAGAPERCLSDLLKELARDPRFGCRDLGLEFFLERDMLCQPVDEWAIEPGGRIRIPAGTRHSCVLRSLERAEVRDYLGDWSAKWTALLESLGVAAGEALTLVRGEECPDPGALYLRLAEDGIVGACLSFAPPDPAGADESVLDAVIDAGLPVAIWLKDPPGDGAGIEAPLREFLARHNVADLRVTVREHRRGARRGDAAGAFGSRVALLWDDPTRPLPVQRLRQPSF